jgi:hypothetical protein
MPTFRGRREQKKNHAPITEFCEIDLDSIRWVAIVLALPLLETSGEPNDGAQGVIPRWPCSVRGDALRAGKAGGRVR